VAPPTKPDHHQRRDSVAGAGAGAGAGGSAGSPDGEDDTKNMMLGLMAGVIQAVSAGHGEDDDMSMIRSVAMVGSSGGGGGGGGGGGSGGPPRSFGLASPSRPLANSGTSGFDNVGNSCYLNSTLQVTAAFACLHVSLPRVLVVGLPVCGRGGGGGGATTRLVDGGVRGVVAADTHPSQCPHTHLPCCLSPLNLRGVCGFPLCSWAVPAAFGAVRGVASVAQRVVQVRSRFAVAFWPHAPRAMCRRVCEQCSAALQSNWV
jgi:hypothetical protein